jgi:hypothetical protein
MAHTVEYDEIYNGLRCVVIFTDMGHRCGYVGINKDHILYNCAYNSVAPPSLQKVINEVKEGEIGKRGAIDILLAALDSDNMRVGFLFNVHGGVTYSGGDKYPVEDADLWWFGFDCAHYMDAKDFESAAMYGYLIHPMYSTFSTGGEVRDLQYCIDECHSLADQLNEIGKEVELKTALN